MKNEGLTPNGDTLIDIVTITEGNIAVDSICLHCKQITRGLIGDVFLSFK
jgi:hypothetical protein